MDPVLVALSCCADALPCRGEIESLTAAVRRALTEVAVLPAWLHGGASTLEAVLGQLTQPAIVVPLLAATPARVLAAVVEAAHCAAASVHVARPLGPHPLLARAQLAALRRAGAQWGDSVVMVAPPGAEDELSLRDTERAAQLLALEWGPQVSLAASPDGTSGYPALPAAIRDWQDTGSHRVFVVPNVLTCGHALADLHVVAREAGAVGVISPVAAHALVGELVAMRYEAVRVPGPVGVERAA